MAVKLKPRSAARRSVRRIRRQRRDSGERLSCGKLVGPALRESEDGQTQPHVDDRRPPRVSAEHAVDGCQCFRKRRSSRRGRDATGPTELDAATLEPQPRLVIDPSRFTLADESSALAQRRGGFRGRGRNEGARAAIVIGTLAAITGAAVLVYANRPECRTNGSANACSYGTKVIGGAVLTAGAVGIVAGSISWR